MTTNSLNTLPLISCLCVTRGTAHLLPRAIRCFQSQTHFNKELIIVYQYKDIATHQLLTTSDLDENVRVIGMHNTGQTLGELRNLSIAAANGTYICQWDGDDWYHPRRLELQYQALSQSPYDACILSHLLLYDGTNQQAYCSYTRLWEGSLLCRKDVFDTLQYPALHRGEDTPLIQQLSAQKKLLAITIPYLYCYIYHAANTWHSNHWQQLFKRSQCLPQELSAVITQLLAISDPPLNQTDLLYKLETALSLCA